MSDSQLQPITQAEKDELLPQSRSMVIDAAKMTVLEWEEEEKQGGRKIKERGPQERDLWLAVGQLRMIDSAPVRP